MEWNVIHLNLEEYCRQNGLEALLEQWNTEKNGGLTPDQVKYGSHQKVWWRCEAGHEWQSAVWSRAGQRTGCPYCANKKVLPENSLAKLDPDLAAQWHPTKNGGLMPDQVSTGSHRLVWWVCEKGHEWRSMIKSRSTGVGCPVCAGKAILAGENDLETTHPELAAQWHPVKNRDLTPRQVMAGSTRKVWWRCEQGHEWQATIAARARGSGCPICSNRIIIPGVNDFASAYPHLARQWLQEKNGSLRPDQVAIGSNQRVWWQCDRGHQWMAAVSSRAMCGTDCPYCSNKRVQAGFNDLQTVMPEIARDWHPTMNGRLTPDQVTVGSSKRVWWQCPYGHVWKAIISSRTGKGKSGCPVCAGKYNQAKQKYYENLEKEAAFVKVMAAEQPEDRLWDPANTPNSLTGQTFGRWTVLDKVASENGIRKWLCRCQCGTEKYVSERHLLSGLSQSCGCLQRDRVKEKLTQDLTGQKFGDLLVLEKAETPEGKSGAWWRCQCSCGTIKDFPARDLKSGARTDCGCKQKNNRVRDLTGQRFGSLEVLRLTDKRSKDHSAIWACRCDCGREVELSSRQLLHQRIMDCGCSGLRGRMKDLRGQKFGELTALYPLPNRSPKGLVIWHCRCDCGRELDCTSTQLSQGKVLNCGCQKDHTAEPLDRLIQKKKEYGSADEENGGK